MNESNGMTPGAARLLGEHLVDSGVLRADQVDALLEAQKADAAAGVRSLVGEIAVRRGWARADEVTRALFEQAREIAESADAGRVLLSRGAVSAAQLAEARARCRRTSETIEEALADLGAATPQALREAAALAAVLSTSAMRRVTASRFSPYNVMELVVAEETNAAIRRDGLCACSQCWSNVFALALNAVPSRYVSDHGQIIELSRRFRQEYGALTRERVAAALTQVRANPKTSCWSRHAEGTGAGRES
jgi:hypothetical protein